MMDPLTTKRRELLKLNEKFPHGSPVKFQAAPADEPILAKVSSTWMMDSGGTPRVLISPDDCDGVMLAHQGQLSQVDSVHTFDVGDGAKVTLTIPANASPFQIQRGYDQVVQFLRNLYAEKEKSHEKPPLGEN